jgi:phytoene dehydrogenase-like protein
MDEQRDVVVVGGGLAGLTAAATAAKAGRSVLVLDGRPGANRGATDQVGRFRFNRGPHALYRTGAGRAVLARLGVAVSGSPPPTSEVFGRRGDQVGPLPSGPVSLVRSPLVSRRGKVRLARVLAGMGRWRPERLADRSAAQWFDDMGLDGDERDVVELLARTTTYVADLERVSADLVAKQMVMGLRGGVDYLDGGWGTLLDGLARAADQAGVERVGAAATSVVPDGGRVRVTVGTADGVPTTRGAPDGQRVTVGTADGTPTTGGAPANGGQASNGAADEMRAGTGAADGQRVILAKAVVIAAGTPETCASLLPERPASWQQLGPPVRVACLDLGLAAVAPMAGLFGADRPLYLSRHDPPADLAPAGGSVVHAMRYLLTDESPPPGEVRADLEEHCRLAGIEPDAAEEARYLHRMVACGAMPTPDTGGLGGRVGVADTGDDGVFVAGDWLGPHHLGDAALSTGEDAGRRAAGHAAGGGQAGRSGATLVAHG